jgi:glycosyltransferase involved in cell wall biosynthesis
VWSWGKYFVYALYQCIKTPSKTLLFFVSNPPFLALIGYLLRKIRKQQYVVLVYDIHPDLLVALGRLKEKGFITRLWHWMNRVVYENAEIVLTIGDYMAANLEKRFDVTRTKPEKVLVVPPWVDTDFIKPIPKSENWFARKYDQVDKLTILYSGNLGATHNIEFIVDLARQLRTQKHIHFLIIGEGSKMEFVQNSIVQEDLENVTLLPFQSEEVLPYSLATGDIAIVTMQPGAEGLMVPSKAYYYLAAGCYLLFNGHVQSEIGQLCEMERVGMVLDGTGDQNKGDSLIMFLKSVKVEDINHEMFNYIEIIKKSINTNYFVELIKYHLN